MQSETPNERTERRKRAGKSAGETFAATLRQLEPACSIDICQPAEDEGIDPSKDLCRYDAIFLSGSPLHVYRESSETIRQIAFMRQVFSSGTPSFGACAGLQIATAAAGGTVRKIPHQDMEAGVARRITATKEGRTHPLLAGRPTTWDALAFHGDEVEELPQGSTRLAGNASSRVQAAEIRFDRGIFWGVQYHPELALAEIAIALRTKAPDIVRMGLAEKEADVEEHADRLQKLHISPCDRSARWMLGIDDEVADERLRRRELINFIRAVPTIDRRPGR
ncbi:type 1 glutamine amidotransferase [Croceibacterium xixiisoli]|uniref:type 1 glutamine amidotransferase n=1 Tax=Croceibacterium xixiisoli TaxID=1476466 RepID=UPI002E2561A3